jgi:hypothetical protein
MNETKARVIRIIENVWANSNRCIHRDEVEFLKELVPDGDNKSSLQCALEYLNHMKVAGLQFKPQRFPRPSWETRDCAVRALTSAANIPYEVAHSVLHKAGRKNSTGTPKIIFENAIFPLGFVPVQCDMIHKPLKDIASRLSAGRWIIGTKTHYFAVVAGAIHDKRRDLVGPGTIVRELYYLNK